MLHTKEIESILARGNDVMIRRRKENGKLVDVIFEVRPNIVQKQTVPVQTEPGETPAACWSIAGNPHQITCK